MLPFDYGQTNPSCSEDASELAVRKDRNFSVRSGKASYDSIGSIRNLCRGLPARTAVAIHVPGRPLPPDFCGRPTFIFAVVPFRQVMVDLSLRRQPRQFAGLSRAFPRAGQDLRKAQHPQARSHVARLPLAMKGQRNFSATGMLARERPFRLTVADEI